MNILVTGNLGYIGSVLTEKLLKKNYFVQGYDIGYFEDSIFLKHKATKIKQIKKDIRDIDESDINEIDIVIHLSALSNDPLGEFDKNLTYQINYESTLKLANICKKKKVKDLSIFRLKACMVFLQRMKNWMKIIVKKSSN